MDKKFSRAFDEALSVVEGAGKLRDEGPAPQRQPEPHAATDASEETMRALLRELKQELP